MPDYVFGESTPAPTPERTESSATPRSSDGRFQGKTEVPKPETIFDGSVAPKPEPKAATGFDTTPQVKALAASLDRPENEYKRFASLEDYETHLAELAEAEFVQDRRGGRSDNQEEYRAERRIEKEEIKPEVFSVELPDDLDKAIGTNLEKLHNHHDKKVRALAEQLETMQGYIKSQARVLVELREERFWSEFDSALATLPDAIKEKFGNGSTFGLGKRSKSMAEREALAEEVLEMQAGQRQSGRRRTTDVGTLVKRLAYGRFPDAIRSSKSEPVEEANTMKLGSGTARPSHRNDSTNGHNRKETPEQNRQQAINRIQAILTGGG